LEGFGHTICNLAIHGSGFIGYSSGTIRDINFVSESVEGHGDGGGLVGNNGGTIIGVTVEATLTRRSVTNAGALAGRNSGTIMRCKSGGSVVGTNAGGLVGVPFGSIDASYSSAKVTAYPDGNNQVTGAGGLVGQAVGPITESMQAEV
jgi:hypothetical protein